MSSGDQAGEEREPGTHAPGGVKDRLIRVGCACLRLYFQYVPISAGKLQLWDHLVRRWLGWRPMAIEARARFGAIFLGDFPDTIHRYLYFFGTWEPIITAYYKTLLRPGDIVVDVGANVGAHALLAANLVGPAGMVHAIEASPWIHARLLRNIARNRITNVVGYQVAVTDVPGQVKVYLNHSENIAGTTIVATEATRRGAIEEAIVEGRPLADIIPLATLRSARLIKVDVEGAEWLVVNGMRDVLPLLRDDVEILLEVSPAALVASGGSLEELLAIFANAGFSAFQIANDYHPRFYISPPALEIFPFRVHDCEIADLILRRVQAGPSRPSAARQPGSG